MYSIVKRIIDIVFSLSLIILISPMLLLVMLVLRFTGEREVFYFQKRIGLKNEYFNIFKFATMLKDSPNMGTGTITLRNDPRVTPMGKFLRMSKINELPQLFNVLLGHMSLVGPRPFVDATFDAYPDHIQKKIYDITPGLTGTGSIAYRDEEEIISNSDLPPAQCYREIIAPHKGELELWYQDNRSLWVDFKVLVVTALSILMPSNRSLLYQFFPSAPKPNSVVEHLPEEKVGS